MGQPVLRWLMVATVTMACSASADLSGEVFVAGPAGDARRGADVEVILVPAHLSRPVGEEWK